MSSQYAGLNRTRHKHLAELLALYGSRTLKECLFQETERQYQTRTLPRRFVAEGWILLWRTQTNKIILLTTNAICTILLFQSLNVRYQKMDDTIEEIKQAHNVDLDSVTSAMIENTENNECNQCHSNCNDCGWDR